MAISIGQRDEDIEGVPRQRKKIVWFWAFTTESRHWHESTRSCYSDQWSSPATRGGSRKDSGRWTISQPERVLQLEIKHARLCPVRKVQKRLLNGPADAIPLYFHAMRTALAENS